MSWGRVILHERAGGRFRSCGLAQNETQVCVGQTHRHDPLSNNTSRALAQRQGAEPLPHLYTTHLDVKAELLVTVHRGATGKPRTALHNLEKQHKRT